MNGATVHNAMDAETQASRRAVAQIMPYFVGRDPIWRETVVHMLRASFATEGRATTNNKTWAWLKDAQRWYKTSLPSFCQRLEVGDYPQNVGIALDRLGQGGFASTDFGRQYRAVPGYRYEASKFASDILRQEEDFRKREANLKIHQDELNKIQTHLDELLPKSNNDSSRSFWQTAWNSVSGFFSQEDRTKDEVEQNKKTANSTGVDRKTKSLLRKVEKLTNHLKGLEDSFENARTKLASTREKRDLLKSPMPNDTFDQAKATVEQVREDFCRFFAEHIAERHKVVLQRYQILDEKTDLTRPQEWFPYARLDKRKIIFHAGPTNSGKTFAALQRLKEAKKGLYLGPLRLLAAEIYENLTTEGIYCDLLTGQEKREIPFATHGAATVEMASVKDDFDVVVIDEIQMITDIERGFAWTRALMGCRCKEIHVCGGAEAEPILRKLAEVCGDELEIVKYQRFSALSVARRSIAKSSDQLGSYKNVEKGDCIVAFSRDDIFSIKREIERLTNFKCCVIYGTLPPQTRSEQARLFNDPDSGFDILVASDAIGMGLNLNIRRIIFNSIYKHDGNEIIRLGHSAIKQIAGRAGRRNSIFPDGIITCRSPEDMPYLKACMATEIEPIQRAGLLPTASHFETFDSTLKEYGKEGMKSSMYAILKHFGEMASLRNDYFLCRQSAMHEIAKAIDQYPLDVRSKYTLCMCPLSTKNKKSMEMLTRFAAKFAAGEISGLTNKMLPRKAKSFEDLAELCGLFSNLDLFLWLQNKFPPGNVIEQQNALALKETVTSMIGEALQQTSKLRLKHCYVTRDAKVRREWKRLEKKRVLMDKFVDSSGGEDEDDDADWNKMVVNS